MQEKLMSIHKLPKSRWHILWEGGLCGLKAHCHILTGPF